jgi:hypothetical protein
MALYFSGLDSTMVPIAPWLREMSSGIAPLLCSG